MIPAQVRSGAISLAQSDGVGAAGVSAAAYTPGWPEGGTPGWLTALARQGGPTAWQRRGGRGGMEASWWPAGALPHTPRPDPPKGSVEEVAGHLPSDSARRVGSG
ncbi:hypothetical protein GCM10028820_04730 [Tessaracoccus terricola]